MSRFSLFRGLSEGLYYSATFHLILAFSLFLLISTFGSKPVYKPTNYVEFEVGDGGESLGLTPTPLPAEVVSPEEPEPPNVTEVSEAKPKSAAEKIVGYEEFKKQLFNPNKNQQVGFNTNGFDNADRGTNTGCTPRELLYKIHSTPIKKNAFIGYHKYTPYKTGLSSFEYSNRSYISIDVSAFSGELILCSHEATEWQLTGNTLNLNKIILVGISQFLVGSDSHIQIEHKPHANQIGGIHASCEGHYENLKHNLSKSLYSEYGKCTQRTISTFGRLENEFSP